MEHIYKTITKTIELDNFKDVITLWFFGDLHRFTPSCDVERWKWFLRCAKGMHDKNTYYMGMGDYTDFASSKEQKILIKGDLHSQTIEDFGDMVRKRNRVLSTEMSFMKGNLLGLIDGNHSWTFSDGTNATEDLANRLGTEFMGWLCHYTLKIKFPNAAHKVQSIYIIACHGKAGGKTAGISINQVDDMKDIFPIGDIYVCGHDHQRYARPVSVLIPGYDGNNETYIKQKRQFLCRSGSFKKAYVPDTSGYEVGRLLRPADLGALQMEIRFHRDTSEGDRIITDIKAII